MKCSVIHPIQDKNGEWRANYCVILPKSSAPISLKSTAMLLPNLFSNIAKDIRIVIEKHLQKPNQV